MFLEFGLFGVGLGICLDPDPRIKLDTMNIRIFDPDCSRKLCLQVSWPLPSVKISPFKISFFPFLSPTFQCSLAVRACGSRFRWLDLQCSKRREKKKEKEKDGKPSVVQHWSVALFAFRFFCLRLCALLFSRAISLFVSLISLQLTSYFVSANTAEASRVPSAITTAGRPARPHEVIQWLLYFFLPSLPHPFSLLLALFSNSLTI